MRRFFKKLTLFLIGLLLIAGLTDRLIGRWADSSPLGYASLIGSDDVHVAVYQAHQPGPQVRRIVLGDSLCRQLFMPGTEPTPEVRYLGSNYAVSMAGQYFLLVRTLLTCPNTREVDLLLRPSSWGNDLPRVLSHDYFCGYFHSPGEVAETFSVTGDWDLGAAHLGRMLLPNLMAANSASHALEVVRPAVVAGGEHVDSPDPEPLLAALTAVTRPKPPATDASPDAMPFSTVSQAFLLKMKTLCQKRSIRFRVLPCPMPSDRHVRCPPGFYEGQVLYFEPAMFIDTIHFRRPWIDSVRKKLIAEYRIGDGT